VTLAKRRLGSVQLSPITFGSMRLHERELDDTAWDRLLRASIEHGVTTFHSSTEYDSHPRFCKLMGGLGRRTDLQHIVKLADPHFGEAAFDRARVATRLDAYLQQLGVERIDVVQWMWRGDLKQEPDRLAGFVRQRDELRDAFDELRRAGKLGVVSPFPYTAAFADHVIEAGTYAGLAVYLNQLEREYLPQIRAAAAAGMGVVALRPLAAGKAVTNGTGAASGVRSVLGEPGVVTAVVSYSSHDHLHDLVGAA
jgi:aryl-alcohol dehydrogenase-like predicted oxidoreductase